MKNKIKAEEEIKINIPKPPTPKINLSIPLIDQFRALKEDQKQRVINYTMDDVMKKYVNTNMTIMVTQMTILIAKQTIQLK